MSSSSADSIEQLLHEIRDREGRPGRTIEITCGLREHVDPKTRKVVKGTGVLYAEVRTGVQAHDRGFGDTLEDALAEAVKRYREKREP